MARVSPIQADEAPGAAGQPIPTQLPPFSVGAREAARLLGVSRSKLYELGPSGPPWLMVGARRCYLVRDLEAWLIAERDRQAAER